MIKQIVIVKLKLISYSLLILAIPFNALCQNNPADLLRNSGFITNQNLSPNRGETVTGDNRRTSTLQNPVLNQSVRLDDVNQREIELEEKLFGYDYFNNPSINFEPNLNMATPQDYIVGPGDQISLIIYGTSQANYNLLVSADGKINIPLLGPVGVSGFSISALSARLKSRLSRIYAGLSGSSPTVFLEVALNQIRSIQVNIMGEVKTPASYVIPAYSNVLNALYAAGGPTVNGTFRKIRIYRGNKLLDTVDLYDFLLKGQNSGSISLSDNDIILVDTYTNHVEISGEVKRPGIFELVENEEVKDIIAYAGGLLPSAYTGSVSLERVAGQNLFAADLSINDQEYDFLDGDRLVVRKHLSYVSEKVQIEGAVNVQGVYQWAEGMTLGDLIAKAQGFLSDAYEEGLVLFRQTSQLKQEAVNGPIEKEIVLQPGDLIVVPQIRNFENLEFVQISGEVMDEKTIPYYEDMTVWDAIVLAGGLKNATLGGRIELIQGEGNLNSQYETSYVDIPQEADQLYEVLSKHKLSPLSDIYVRKSPGYREKLKVIVQGEVLYPGEYVLTGESMRLSELIGRVGGVTKDAFLPGATLFRRNENYKERAPKYLEVARLEKLLEQVDSEKAINGSLNIRQRELLENRLSSLRDQLEEDRTDSVQLITDRLSTRIDTFLLNSRYQGSLDLGYNANQNGLSLSFEDKPNLESLSDIYDQIGIDLEKIISSQTTEDDMILMPGDKLVIPRKQEVVRLRGEVQYPTATRFKTGYNLKDYVSQGGGFTLLAKRNQSYVIYPNGEASRTKNFIFFRVWPKIEPGSEIIIPGGRQRQGLARVQQVFGILTGAAGVVTSYFLVRELANSNN